MIGICLYHSRDLGADTGAFERLLQCLQEQLGSRAELRYIDGMLAESGTFLRTSRLSTHALTEVAERIASGTLSSVSVHEERPRSKTFGREGVSVHLELVARKPRGQRAFCPYRAYLLLPPSLLGADEYYPLIAELWAVLDPAYGFVYVGRDHEDALMEVTLIPMLPWDADPKGPLIERVKRLDRLQDLRGEIGRKVCGAYWANCLGPALVNTMGGRDTVLERAPVNAARPLGDEGAYLQLTEGVEPAERNDRTGKLEVYFSETGVLMV